jgi:hypothetical protein
VAGIDEAQRAQLVPDLAVEVDLGRGVPVLQAYVSAQSCSARPKRRLGRFAPCDFVREHELQEVCVGHVSGLGQREAFGEGGGAKCNRATSALQIRQNGLVGGVCICSRQAAACSNCRTRQD